MINPEIKNKVSQHMQNIKNSVMKSRAYQNVKRHMDNVKNHFKNSPQWKKFGNDLKTIGKNTYNKSTSYVQNKVGQMADKINQTNNQNHQNNQNNPQNNQHPVIKDQQTQAEINKEKVEQQNNKNQVS